MDHPPPSRIEHDFNFGWKFALMDNPGAKEPVFDDTAWRELRLPHDWSVEASFDPHNGEGATGYLPGGVGWYRKHFATPAESSGRLAFLLFDGIYNNADVWLNGHHLGSHPYGYSPFYFDITPYLKKDGEDNVVAVRVDRTRFADSRWYTGSGIYRHVKLICTDRLHVPIWGTYVTTPSVSADQASVQIDVSVKNAYDKAVMFELRTELLDKEGRPVAAVSTTKQMAPAKEAVCTQTFVVESPRFWDTTDPYLYEAVTSILVDGRVIDRYVTPFGIRSLRFDPDSGFYLNDVNTPIKGVCLHHDAGLVGSAVPVGVWERRLKILRALGCNAIRTAHNPPSQAFLDLCDRMGFLVQDEFFDEWDNPKDKRRNRNEQSVDDITRGYTEHFARCGESDLKSTMLRDRNHPCIFMWSIGNEIEWTYTEYEEATGYWDPFGEEEYQPNYFWDCPPRSTKEIADAFARITGGNSKLAGTAKALSGWVKQMDTTRPVTANLILPEVSHLSGFTDALDVVGYSYRQVLYEYGHRHYPDKMLYGAENFAQWHEWKSVLDYAYIPGIFLWTGIDYMGEADGKWPVKGTPSGVLDFAGFIKPSGHMMKTLWNDEPHVYATTKPVDESPYQLNTDTGELLADNPDAWKKALWTWHDVNHHWNYTPGQMICVEVYTNCDSVELFLNGNSCGVKMINDFDDRIIKYAVPFEAGTLEVVGTTGDCSSIYTIATAAEPAGIILTADKQSIHADGYDVAHIVAHIVDGEGNPVKHHEREIVFTIDGVGRSLGIDNGASDNTQDYQSDRLTTSRGRCMLIVQAERSPGQITVTARSVDLEAEIVIDSEAVVVP